MPLQFEWDRRKARSNVDKHGASFEEASTAFADTFSITIGDPLHSEQEDRFVLVGMSCRGRVLVVAHTERADRIRIISARPAVHTERETYEDARRQ